MPSLKLRSIFFQLQKEIKKIKLKLVNGMKNTTDLNLSAKFQYVFSTHRNTSMYAAHTDICTGVKGMA